MSQAAAVIAVDFSAPLLPEEVWDLVKHLPPTGRAARKLVESLPERQWQILYGTAEGMSTKELASYLGISPKTVEYHRKGLEWRVKLDGPVALTRLAIRAGLIEA